MHDLSLIKQRISCVDVAQRCGLPIQRSGDRCVSPLRAGATNKSSFTVTDDFYYDFGSGSGGDCIDLLAELKHGGNRGAAIRELASLTGVTDDNPASQEWVEYTNQLNARTAFYHSQLTEDDRNYLRSRGISDSDADRLMIGRVTDGPLRGRLFLPYHHPQGYVCYYATRALPGSTFPESKYMKQRKDEHCQHIPWGLQTLTRSTDHRTLVIAEGYFDAAAFEVSGYPVISAITGTFSKHQVPTVISAARNFDQVFIVYDNDPVTGAGASFTQRTAELLTRHRIPFIVGTVPTPYHDISEYYAAGGDLQRIIDSAEDGISYIASRMTDFAALESFVYTVARHTKRTQMDELFSKLKKLDRWNEKTLISLFKSATTAPPENIVADEILEAHQLVYVPSVGFYEYGSGVWTRITDEAIQSYADKTLGEFSTHQRTKAITGLIKTRALRSDIQFNSKPVWNFVNGTLELETGNFRDHNPNDYCSMQVSYPYNPSATYHSWSRFINDITAGDPRAAELLQFIPGYALMQDCRYEKIFVLSGNGSNGKSKYLEILRQLFGFENVSHLQPRALLDKFKLIYFRESVLNIAGEIRSDLRDVEELMKSIASGEPQMACYKSKDYVTFVPRTKMIFATNNQLASGDTSDGLTRRLVMVDFKVSFVDNPDPNDPYQRQKNVDILDELTGELHSGGIFNWAYAGYQLLRTVGYFTETHDQTQLIQDFKRSSNPILVFWEDHHGNFGDEISNHDLYRNHYFQWCSDNGEKTVSSITFHREFKKVSSRVYEPYRTSKERGYRRIAQ
jgi:P4 family phage/plasmid primase-like protien